MSKKKRIDFDTQKMIAWCKNNIVLVILAIVSVGAIVGLPKVAQGLSNQVEDSLRNLGGNFTKLDKISSTKVTLPGSSESVKVVVNQSFLEQYIEVTESLRGDAQTVVDYALELNHKSYVVLFASTLFPSPNQSQRETLPQRFFRQLETDYKALLEQANAGLPSSDEELVAYLEDSRVRFMETNLSTKQDADLTSEQKTSLTTHLASQRISQLRSRAKEISVYLDEGTLGIPAFSLNNMPSIGELFNWQWRYWVVADAIGAIAAINDGQTSLTSPIKRVVDIEVLGLPLISDVPTRGGGGGTGGGGGPKPPRPVGPGGGTPNPFGPGGSPSTPKPPPINPGSGGGPSRSGDGGLVLSHTGRVSNELYDLLQIRLNLIVDSQRILSVLDGLSQFNFFTVIDLELVPVDKFVAMSAGYDYGSAAVSQMTIVLESAWLRAWTTEFMPNSVKQALGIEVNEDE